MSGNNDNNVFKSVIARKLITYVILFSSLITLLITAGQLYWDYRKDISYIETQLDQVNNVHLKSLTGALWASDVKELHIHLDGILQIRDMQYLEIADHGKVWATAGDKTARKTISREYPLIYSQRKRDINIGTLTVVVSLSGVYQRILDRVWVILVSNAIKTFLVAGFILVVFHNIITSHLIRITDHIRKWNINRLHEPLELDREEGGSKNHDELDLVVDSINKMEINIEESFVEIKDLNKDLERRVEERTIKLSQSIDEVKRENDERKRAEKLLIEAKEEAERANSMKSEFLGRMSHELRTPMNAIIGFGQLLKDEDLSAAERDYTNEIMIAAKHLLDLINEVLDLSSIEAEGMSAMTMEAVSLSDIAFDCTALVTPMTETNQVQIINDIDPHDEIYIYADKVRIKEVLINLLSNAVKYNVDGGTVTVNCEIKNPVTVRINVIDTGPGITSDKYDDLFEPFDRLGAEYSEIEGTGIGLTISRQLIELMDGVIGVESEPGKGSVFWIECRISEKLFSRQNHSEPAQVVNCESGEQTVLYIEDNVANQKLVGHILERRPHVSLMTALDAETGIDLAIKHIPGIIILDINLPGINGYEALARLSNIEETRNIPVFALSVAAMPQDIEKGMLAGFTYYLTKPVQVEDLLEAIDSTISRLLAARK